MQQQARKRGHEFARENKGDQRRNWKETMWKRLEEKENYKLYFN